DSHERRSSSHRTLYARRSQHDELRTHHRRSEDLHEALEDRISYHAGRGIRTFRILLSRDKLRHVQLAQRRSCRGGRRSRETEKIDKENLCETSLPRHCLFCWRLLPRQQARALSSIGKKKRPRYCSTTVLWCRSTR